MVAVSQVLLASENFKENAVLNLKELWRSREFTDVTLVSADGIKLDAHKNVLSSSSSLFKQILIGNQHPSVLLYLRGVSRRELELLLEFSYTGECQVEALELKSFLRTAKEFGIKGLLENFLDVPKTIPVVESLENDGIEELAKERNIISDLKSCFDEGPVNIELLADKKPNNLGELDPEMICDISEEASSPTWQNNRSHRSKSEFHEGPAIEVPLDKKPLHVAVIEETSFDENPTKADEWECVNCSKSFRSEMRLQIHMKRVHGTEVLCKTCGHKAFSRESLSLHEQNVHGQLRFMCDQCPFHANNLEKLKRHKNVGHSGVIYQCNQCGHKPYREQRGLVKHMKWKHSGLAVATFKCEYCDYEARSEKLLKKHIHTMKTNNEESHQYNYMSMEK